MTEQQKQFRKMRTDARKKILAAANRHSQVGHFKMQNIQEAVHLVRHWNLIDPVMLLAAGYNWTNRDR